LRGLLISYPRNPRNPQLIDTACALVLLPFCYPLSAAFALPCRV
jgi:hypothetical protein